MEFSYLCKTGGPRTRPVSPVGRAILLPLVNVEKSAPERTPIYLALHQLVEPLPALGQRQEAIDVPSIVVAARICLANPPQRRKRLFQKRANRCLDTPPSRSLAIGVLDIAIKERVDQALVVGAPRTPRQPALAQQIEQPPFLGRQRAIFWSSRAAVVGICRRLTRDRSKSSR
jgi:hypothetical protein